MTYLETIKQAEAEKKAIGHFNISNIEGFHAVIESARGLDLPVIIGVSEGERKFIGVKQVKALVDSAKAEGRPVWLNADHTYSFDGVKEVVDAGFDSVIFDGSNLELEENIKITKQCVDYAKDKNPDILIEGEIGYIGTSSKVLEEIPAEVVAAGKAAVTPEIAKQYVEATGVDLLSPAVGNIHGMLKHEHNPKLKIELIKEIRAAAGVPLVLHGGSGITDDDFRAAIVAGISLVHINTEIRVAFQNALKQTLQENPDEIAPYRLLAPAVSAMEAVITKRLKLFAGKNV
ncbi:MAG: class II fructose-bisphosphate aldolase [Candidatus Paceibacterota bacterium]